MVDINKLLSILFDANNSNCSAFISIIVCYYVIKIKSSNKELNFLFLSGAFSLVSVLFGLFEVDFFRGRLLWFFQLYFSIFVLEFFQSKKIVKQE